MNFWLISAFYLLIAFLGVGIFLWGKPDGDSLFDRLYRCVCVYCPRLLKKLLEKCCGKRAPAALDAAWVYICYTCNPIVQIFYLAVVIGGYLSFVQYGYPHLPNQYVGGWHKYTGFCVFLACVFTWWTACRRDPGTINERNVDEYCTLFEWDNQIFSSAMCETCQVVKPARSKHCALCNICVARFDHHCIWINNCVGLGNHRWFLGFLFVHLGLCFYGGSLGSIIIYEVIKQKDLFNAVFVDPVTKQRHVASKLIIVQYMLATEGPMIFVAALCFIMGIALCGFFVWHLNLVRIGTTTNELSKWQYVKWCLKQEGEESKWKDVRNIYNNGLIANLREVFFPPINTNSVVKGQEAPEEPSAQGNKSRKAKKHD